MPDKETTHYDKDGNYSGKSYEKEVYNDSKWGDDFPPPKDDGGSAGPGCLEVIVLIIFGYLLITGKISIVTCLVLGLIGLVVGCVIIFRRKD